MIIVTIKQIAELCGVSRGTVDRVLNHRGNVKEEKKQLILATAKKLHYHPNLAGKSLAARKKHQRIGVVIPSIDVHFFDDVLHSMRKEANKMLDYGIEVLWREMKGFDVEEEIQLIQEIKDQVQALIIDPINDERIAGQINECVKEGKLVVTINNDIADSLRHCYVGSNYVQGGRTAAGLLKMLRPHDVKAAIFLGSYRMLGHHQRLDGFLDLFQNDSTFQCLGIKETNDDDFVAYAQAQKMLQEHPELNTFYVISSGASYGIAKAVVASGRHDITFIVFDTIPTTIQMMHRHIIQAAIYQHPHQQGIISMRIAFDYLVKGEYPSKSQHLLRNEIRILENVDENPDDYQFGE